MKKKQREHEWYQFWELLKVGVPYKEACKEIGMSVKKMDKVWDRVIEGLHENK